MAHKTMHLTQAGVQQYKTRMMVGDPVTLSGADARRLEKIGWVEEPKRRKVPEKAPEPAPEAEVTWTPAPAVVEAVSAPKTKRAAPRRKAKNAG